ncbi:hypothetical protein AAFF_G00313130 [Aldrovandia affinis]|uniref:G-protein coupled receptors family 1 profile domain-containing protein n=1 Tax=Aldrovandia affinis TaxID=143900 RepID=A0AAD7SQE9_9TELE|nr:hypothetical protein AAFF_G00313130 [Aldrovandia affinis]
MEPGNLTESHRGLGNCTVDTSYRFLYYQVSYSLIFIFGLASNALALHRLWGSPRTLTSTTGYHRMAPSDLGAPWSPGGPFCRLTFTLKYISLYGGGIFFLVCIGVERYLAVVRARVPSAAAAHRPAAERRHLAAFLLPALVLLFSYCGVLRALRGPGGGRTLTVVYWVMAIFLLCFAPYHLNLLGYTLTHLGLVAHCGLAAATKAFHPVALSLASANCCLNPLVYYFHSHLHREGARGGSSSQ